MRTIILASLLLAGVAPAGVRAAPSVPANEPSAFGLALDVGVPEGIAPALTVHPFDSVRLWAGPAWNYVAWGVHGGAAVIPWSWAVSPSLSVELGRYFDADLSRFVNDGSGAPRQAEPLLRSVGYGYAAVHLGLEIGARPGLSFSIRAGLAHVRARGKGTARSTESDGAEATVVTVRDPRVDARIPSVKLGLHYSF